ncbi:MAG TPA: type II toxin-antitoxin system VapC family toxin [Terriglobales bacterium]|jgi:PIN domain nuclease of toxin-antitoxin system
MRLLPDTHLLLWGAVAPERLSALARRLISDEQHELFYSAASLWEVAIKIALGKRDFTTGPAHLRERLLANGYQELPVTGRHAVAVAGLPLIHKDPFDRLLVAQALVEDITLLTVDARLARYPAPVRLV